VIPGGGEGGIGPAAAAGRSSFRQAGISVFRHVLAAEATEATRPPLAATECRPAGGGSGMDGGERAGHRKRGVDKSSLGSWLQTLPLAIPRLGRWAL